VPAAKFRKVFLDSIERTFTPEVMKIIKYYENAMKGADKIRIVADDGTDLAFSIKGRPLLVDKGFISREDITKGDFGLNIPAGEVFFAPQEHSANGIIIFDYATISGFGLVRNLKIKFKNGKVAWFKADGNGAKIFRRFLDSNTGEKDRIAELGIGCNPAAQFIGKTIVDEKIFGSVHIAIGNNTGSYHGKNRASSHLDMVKIMKGRNGCMYADGKLVMKNGMPLKKI
jgi:aminopeptidase